MRVVIFTGGEYSPPELTKTYFSQHKADYCIAADSGLQTLERYNKFYGGIFEPSAIIGDMDSLTDKTLLSKYPKDRIRSCSAYKDFSDTELALELAHKELAKSGGKDDWITLVGAGGGERADHFIAVFDLFATDLHPDVWICGKQAFWHAPSGTSFEISGLSQNDIISVARTTQSRTGGSITSEGLEWEYGLFRKEGMPSLSNRISSAYFAAGKNVKISVKEGCFVLILPVTVCVKHLLEKIDF